MSGIYLWVYYYPDGGGFSCGHITQRKKVLFERPNENANIGNTFRWQGRGIGAGLIKDAMRRTIQVADIVGIRALAVHAKDNNARSFYEHFDFIPSPTDPLHLFILTKDLRRVTGIMT